MVFGILINRCFARRKIVAGLAGAFFVLAALHADARTEAGMIMPWPLELRGHMQAANAVEYRLRRALGAKCAAPTPVLGLALDHLAQYHANDRARVAALAGLGGGITVIAVAPGSPAAIAGLAEGDILLALNGAALEEGGGSPAVEAMAALDFQAIRGPVAVRFRRSGHGTAVQDMTAMIEPVRLCGARLVVVTDDTVRAYTDGSSVALTTGLLRFTANQDEVALVSGHEMAHAVLQHARNGSRAALRGMEDEADLVGARLATCAGYDMARAADFWLRFRPQSISDVFGLPIHRSPRERYRRLLVHGNVSRAADCAQRQD